ncbi:MAG: enoyl-CoA hydratase-related protein, partial [Actinomycetota bacterium]|nr:enoyl-CoA hydratase-related protein [Actinomycetota bacterium]
AWLLARHPVSVASQLVLTGRRFNGPDLHRLGVALDVVADAEVKESARTLAADLAAWPSANVRNLKGAIRDLGAGGGSLSDPMGGRAWFDQARASTPLPTGGAMRPIHVDGEGIDR